MLRSVEIKTWFIEPVFTKDKQLSTGRVRVWGKTKDSQRSARWWRSSSIRQRLSSTSLRTRYGTLVTLKGGICKKYARKLRMDADAIERFHKGFPATWKKMLQQSFSADILKESDRHVQPRRSARNFDKKHKEEPAKRERHELPPQDEGVPSTEGKTQGQPNRRSMRKRSQSNIPLIEEPTRKPTRQPTRKSSRKKSAESSTESNPEHTLATKLKKAQKEKKARRARRVAFADAPVSTRNSVSVPKHGTPKPKRPRAAVSSPSGNDVVTVWSNLQRMAFERQRNSVAADTVEYWETIAAGVKGKSARECEAMWESSWMSPQAKEVSCVPTTGKSAEDVIADLQKAVKTKRSRNTAKFRSQARKLAELVAEGTLDTALEPPVPGAAAAENIAVTPRLQGTATLVQGTPGTEVRQKWAQNEKAGSLATPEILSRGRKVGFAEADHYVSLFKRRAGKGDGKGAQGRKVEDSCPQVGINLSRRLSDENDLRRVRGNDGNDSEYSDESSPFF